MSDTSGFDTFLFWERASRDTIDFKKTYVDMAGDLIAGLLLSQIVYWYLPSKNGQDKIRVHKKGKEWIAKGRDDWWDEIRITAKQFDRAIKALVKLKIVETKLFHFNGKPTKHVRINKEVFLQHWRYVVEEADPELILPKGQNAISPKVKMDFDERSNYLTESTAESTADNKDFASGDADHNSKPKRERKPNPYYDAVHTVWGFVRSRNGSFQKMLQGKATDATHKPGNVEPAMTPDEIINFGRWYMRDHTVMVTSPAKVQSDVAKYRALKATQEQCQKQPDKMLNLPEDFDPRIPEHHEIMVAEMQRVNGMAS